MKLGNCEAWNFGSYAHIIFDMSDIGLSLVQGKTGSGKSTLPDIPCWILYGVTSKNGTADEVRSWFAPDQPTKGELDVRLHDGTIRVTRIRGRAAQNDLYWTEGGDDVTKIRGKDISETQKRLSKRIGVDSDLYLSASYFCDFSPSGQFFTAKASMRRDLFDRIASLEFPVQLAEKAASARKADKKELEKAELDLAKWTGKREQLAAGFIETEKSLKEWADKRGVIKATLQKNLATAKKDAACIPALEANIDFIKDSLKELEALKPELIQAQQEVKQTFSELRSFQNEHDRLSKIENQCPSCLSPQANNTARLDRVRHLQHEIKRAQAEVSQAELKVERIEAVLDKEPGLQNDLRKSENDKNDKARRLEQAQRELDALDPANPFEALYERSKADISTAKTNEENAQHRCDSLRRRVSLLSRLYDLSADLRGALLTKAVKEVEKSTNNYLDKYFDAEIRVAFEPDGDDLEVAIQKSGFTCSFRQLSKGQQQLLKLCFAVAIMSASANSAGIHFENLFFDEALDGLDDDLKVKAFAMFEELSAEHSSVLLIDHAPAFQNLFANRYKVTMESDISTIETEDG